MSEPSELGVPFLKWAEGEILAAAGDFERVAALFEKVGEYVRGCESVRDATQDKASAAFTERDDAQAALVHATNRLAETDALVAELRQKVQPLNEELSQITKAHGLVCADNAKWQDRYDLMVLAVRWADENCEALRTKNPPQGFKDALGFA